MKYKALFLDVDSTTVVHGEDNLPSDRGDTGDFSVSQERSFVSLATSRTFSTVYRVIEHLGLDGYHVISSGSQLYDATLKKL